MRLGNLNLPHLFAERLLLFFLIPKILRRGLWLALQDLSQPKTEASPPDGVLAVPLLRHQVLSRSLVFYWVIHELIALVKNR